MEAVSEPSFSGKIGWLRQILIDSGDPDWGAATGAFPVMDVSFLAVAAAAGQLSAVKSVTAVRSGSRSSSSSNRNRRRRSPRSSRSLLHQQMSKQQGSFGHKKDWVCRLKDEKEKKRSDEAKKKKKTHSVKVTASASKRKV